MGGHQETPKQPTPMEEAQAKLLLDQEEAKRNEQLRIKQQQEKDAIELKNRNQTIADTNAAYSRGTAWGAAKAKSLGYADNYGLLDQFNRALGDARASVPRISDNVGSYFNYDDIWNKVANNTESTQRTALDNAYRGLTKPGWEQGYFADSADDDILRAIMGDQYGAAFDTLDAARARGQLSDGAFQSSLASLNNKKEGAMSTLQDLGGGVLSGYRKQLDDIAKSYSDSITNYKLGQNLNMNDFSAALDQRKTDLMGRMRGDIYRALGDTSLFNTDTIMAKGNAAAGVSNNPLRNAFADATLDPNRTTGTAGVF